MKNGKINIIGMKNYEDWLGLDYKIIKNIKDPQRLQLNIEIIEKFLLEYQMKLLIMNC